MNSYTILHVSSTNQELKEKYKDHTTYNKGDSGLDLFTPFEVKVPAKAMGFIIDLEISCEMLNSSVTSTASKSYYLYPRSSMSKTPLRLSNSVGIIDAGYRGNIMIALDNLSDQPYTIEKDTRLVQICSGTLEPFYMKTVDKLSHSIRGKAGFGSTGK